MRIRSAFYVHFSLQIEIGRSMRRRATLHLRERERMWKLGVPGRPRQRSSLQFEVQKQKNRRDSALHVLQKSWIHQAVRWLFLGNGRGRHLRSNWQMEFGLETAKETTGDNKEHFVNYYNNNYHNNNNEHDNNNHNYDRASHNKSNDGGDYNKTHRREDADANGR